MRVDVRTLGVAVLAFACTRPKAAPQPTELRESGRPAPVAVVRADNRTDASDAGEQHAPLSGFPEQFELLDEKDVGPSKGGQKLGFASVPLGAREPRPIMVA